MDTKQMESILARLFLELVAHAALKVFLELLVKLLSVGSKKPNTSRHGSHKPSGRLYFQTKPTAGVHLAQRNCCHLRYRQIYG